MKKQLKFLLLTSTIGCTAMAGVSVDMRADDVSTSYNSTMHDAGNLDNYQFKFKNLRFELKGTVVDDLSYHFRFNIPNMSDVPTSRDKVGYGAAEIATISHKFNDMISFDVGKFQLDLAGWENQVTSPDRYVDSGYLSFVNTFKYQTGAKVNFTFGDHMLTLTTANQETDATDPVSSKFNQNRGITGLSYFGKFMDGTLKPMVSYYADAPQNAPSTFKPSNSYTTAGLRFDYPTWMLDLDYDMASLVDASIAGQTDSYNGMEAQFTWKGDFFVPKVKYDTTDHAQYSSATTKTTTTTSDIGLIAEFHPKSNLNLNYHLAYIQTSSKADSAANASVTTQYVAGIRINTDLLK